jgi:transposase-like protein
VEIVTDGAPVYLVVLEELLPVVWHRTEQYANTRVECDHGHRKSRLRPMLGRNETTAPGL